MKKDPLLILLSAFCLHASAQKEWSNWYHDGNTPLTFKNGFAEHITDVLPVPHPSVLNFKTFRQGGISYSDPATGEMKTGVRMTETLIEISIHREEESGRK